MGKDGHCHGSDFRGNYARPADWLLKIGYRRSKTRHPVLPLYLRSGHSSFPMPAYHTRATTSTADNIMPVYSFQEGMSQAINLPNNTEASRTKLTINDETINVHPMRSMNLPNLSLKSINTCFETVLAGIEGNDPSLSASDTTMMPIKQTGYTHAPPERII